MKMKLIIIRIIPAFFTTALLLVSCQKNLDSKSNGESKANLQHATDMAGLENLVTVDEVQQFVLSAYPNSAEAKELLAGCSPVTTVIFRNPPNRFPRTEIVDYGTGCTNQFRVTGSGRIIKQYTDTLANVGARFILGYDNYFINGVHIEGKNTITHIQLPNTSTYKLVLIDRKVTQPNGDFIIYNGERNLIKYVPDDIRFPDPTNTSGWYKLTGTRSGDEMKGGVSSQWLASIDDNDPLIYKFCGFVTKGTLHVQFTNQSDWLVNFGKVFECDDKADVTQDGVTTTVTLPLEP